MLRNLTMPPGTSLESPKILSNVRDLTSAVWRRILTESCKLAAVPWRFAHEEQDSRAGIAGCIYSRKRPDGEW